MLKRQKLEAVDKAWPDYTGVSNDPETYNDWIEKENRYLVKMINKVLGADRLNSLSEKQRGLLDASFKKLLECKSLFDITEDEILGEYEMITVYVAPIELELAWKVFVENKSNN